MGRPRGSKNRDRGALRKGGSLSLDQVGAQYKQLSEALPTITSVPAIQEHIARVKALRQFAQSRYADQTKVLAEMAEHQTRAERRLGELLEKVPKAKGTKGRIQDGMRGATGGTRETPPVEAEPTLADLGVTKKESSQAQKLSKIPLERFEAKVEELKEAGVAPTKTAVLEAQELEPAWRPTVVEPRVPRRKRGIRALSNPVEALRDQVICWDETLKFSLTSGHVELSSPAQVAEVLKATMGLRRTTRTFTKMLSQRLKKLAGDPK